MQRFGNTDGARWFERATGRVERFEAFTQAEGRQVRLVGTAVAREGVAFLSPVRVPVGEMPFTFMLRRRTIPSRVRVIKGDTVEISKRIMHRYYCTFAAIAADDLEAVIRYVDDRPEPAAARHAEQGAVSLSRPVMAAILERLVQLKRLAPPAPGTAPLIRLTAGPVRDVDGARGVRDVVVHSRITVAQATHSYNTTFRVFADDHVDLVP